jgi:hypothetical protein
MADPQKMLTGAEDIKRLLHEKQIKAVDFYRYRK